MPVTWRQVEKGILPDAFTLESPQKLAGFSRRRARRAA
jgi:hypothetical protein